MIHQNIGFSEVEQILVDKGIDRENAKLVIESVSEQIDKAGRKKAVNDIIYGSLWCVVGIAATVADIGFIFWGAIVFGAAQLFRGLTDL